MYVHSGTTGECLARWCWASGEIFSPLSASVAYEDGDSWVERCRARWPDLEDKRGDLSGAAVLDALAP